MVPRRVFVCARAFGTADPRARASPDRERGASERDRSIARANEGPKIGHLRGCLSGRRSGAFDRRGRSIESASTVILETHVAIKQLDRPPRRDRRRRLVRRGFFPSRGGGGARARLDAHSASRRRPRRLRSRRALRARTSHLPLPPSPARTPARASSLRPRARPFAARPARAHHGGGAHGAALPRRRLARPEGFHRRRARRASLGRLVRADDEGSLRRRAPGRARPVRRAHGPERGGAIPGRRGDPSPPSRAPPPSGGRASAGRSGRRSS